MKPSVEINLRSVDGKATVSIDVRDLTTKQAVALINGLDQSIEEKILTAINDPAIRSIEDLANEAYNRYQSNKLLAVKWLKESAKIGLREAKEIMDNYNFRHED